MTNKNEEPSYWAVIPANVRYDKSLSPYARLLYGELTALSKKEGYAWASNKYFAELYQVERSSVSHWIKSLQKKGYIRIQFIFDDTKTYIKERRIYLTNQRPAKAEINKDIENPIQESPNNSQSPEISLPDDSSALDCDNAIYGGGYVGNQGGGYVGNQGGYVEPRIIIQANNTRSSSSDPPEIKKPPPEEEADFVPENAEKALHFVPQPDQPGKLICDLKDQLRQINPTFVFDGSFYQKAIDFMAFHRLDPGYVPWMNKFCIAQSPKKIDCYFYTVFFEPRLAELYKLETSRPPPVKTIKTLQCPVCGFVHGASDLFCIQCHLSIHDLHNSEKIAAEKQIYDMSPDAKEAYYSELKKIDDEFQFNDFVSRNQKIKALKEKYGLNSPLRGF